METELGASQYIIFSGTVGIQMADICVFKSCKMSFYY